MSPTTRCPYRIKYPEGRSHKTFNIPFKINNIASKKQKMYFYSKQYSTIERKLHVNIDNNQFCNQM